MPKFGDMTVWQQAEQLMQPTFIRLIDNLRKQLDQSSWRGTYEDVLVWPEDVSDSDKTQVMRLRLDLEQATSPEAAVELEQALAKLPAPYPGYLLRLTQQNEQVTVDLWELCYRICFRDYDATTGTSRSRGFGQSPSQSVEVDTTLFDETGDVDWNRLDAKTIKVVAQIFANLPAPVNDNSASDHTATD